MRDEQTQTERQPYEAPQLTHFGSVTDLTRNNRGSTTESRQGGNDTCNGLGKPC